MEEMYGEDQTTAIAERILSLLAASDTQATVVGLQGDLGAGKTTITKALARQLGVTDTVVSPTFVIAKFYTLHQSQGKEMDFEHLIHIDAYRIDSVEELQPLGWSNMVVQPNTLIVVEWPERIESALPDETHHFLITHEGNQRLIKKTV
jgi:tRNA threonylcarbamoyladenosine biosynthesis protein TsaE